MGKSQLFAALLGILVAASACANPSEVTTHHSVSRPGPTTTETALSPSPTAQAPGILTGVASPCWPYASDNGIGEKSVTVTVARDGQTVASQTVRGDHIYRFMLSPGSYIVSTPYSRVKAVTIINGRTVTADLPDDCI